MPDNSTAPPPPRRDVLAAVASSRRVFNAVKALPCDVHGAPPGQPCRVVPAVGPRERPHLAVCGKRIDSLRSRSC